MPTLEVTVFSSKLKGVRDDIPIPIYEDAVEHPEVTRGKQGGTKSKGNLTSEDVKVSHGAE